MNYIQLHEYEYFPPSGFALTGGLEPGTVIDYESRLRNSGTWSGNPHGSVIGFAQFDEYQDFSTEEKLNLPPGDIYSIDKPVVSAHPKTDMHRWINEKVKEFEILDGFSPFPQVTDTVKALEQLIEDFVEKHGDFFSNNVHGENYVELSIFDWYNEWKAIGIAATDAATEQGKEKLLAGAKNQKTILNENLYAKNENGDDREPITIKPDSLLDWCWALVARDILDNVTYKKCINHKSENNPTGCEHEVPSIDLDGKTGQEYCSAECREK